LDHPPWPSCQRPEITRKCSKVHRGQPANSGARASMPAHTIFAPILLPPPSHHALQPGKLQYESDHVFFNLSYYSHPIRNTLRIDPAILKLPRTPRHLFCRNGPSLVWNISAPNQGTTQHTALTHTWTGPQLAATHPRPTLSSLGNLLFLGSRKTGFSTITTGVRSGPLRGRTKCQKKNKHALHRRCIASRHHHQEEKGRSI
jgi:hypothetical protein